MKLYDYCRSSAAYRVRIALNLKGLEYEHISVNLLEGKQSSDEYKQINPQGLVPSLEDNDNMLNQSLAILEYLEEAYPKTTSLLPESITEKSRVRSLALSIACDIHPVNNLRILKYLVGELGATEEQKLAWYAHWITEGFTALEQQLSSSEFTGKFCHGDKPTLVDLCLIPQVFNAKRFNVPMENFTTINRIVENCEALEAFIKAHPANQPDS